MKLFWLLLLVAQVAIGCLALLRFGENVMGGKDVTFAIIQLVIGVMFLFGAWQSLRRARAAR
jgi:multisubunit Na+/H+ antiporter MnhG subunit